MTFNKLLKEGEISQLFTNSDSNILIIYSAIYEQLTAQIGEYIWKADSWKL